MYHLYIALYALRTYCAARADRSFSSVLLAPASATGRGGMGIFAAAVIAPSDVSSYSQQDPRQGCVSAVSVFVQPWCEGLHHHCSCGRRLVLR